MFNYINKNLHFVFFVRAKKGFVLILAALFFISLISILPINNALAYFPNANIVGGNCDPLADPAEDATKTDPTQKSCISQNIFRPSECLGNPATCNSQNATLNPFKVSVLFDPNFLVDGKNLFALTFPSLCNDPSGDQNCGSTADVLANLTPRTTQLIVGDPPVKIFQELNVFFSANYKEESNSACVTATFGYANTNNSVYRVEKKMPTSCNQIAGFSEQNDPNLFDECTRPIDLSFRPEGEIENCITAPNPKAFAPTLNWNNNFISPVCLTLRSTQLQSRDPFLGLIVQCVEDTMLNIFAPTRPILDSRGNEVTVFTNMQKNLNNTLRAIFAIYIIIIGYKLIMGKEVPKRNQWSLYAFKLVIVMYFAIGPGLTPYLRSLITSEKELSLIVMDAGMGRNSSISSSGTALVRQGYNYCSLSNATYPAGYESYRLWETIDCKLKKYLGIGDYNKDTRAPKTVLIALSSIFSTALGFPIFVFTLIYILFIILLSLKVVSVYIISILQIFILVFFSPIAIIAVLFEFTKSIFDTWLRLLLAAFLQPVMLFAFFGFMFTIMDLVYFGNNKTFVTPSNITSGQALNQILTKDASGSNLVDCTTTNQLNCTDKKAPGYIMQTLQINFPCFVGPLCDWVPKVVFPKVNFANGQDYDLMYGLLKLILICFVIQVLITAVIQLSARLVSALSGADGGLAAMSPISNPSVQDIAGAALNTTGKAADLAGSGAGWAVRKARGKVTASTGAEGKSSKPMDSGKALAQSPSGQTRTQGQDSKTGTQITGSQQGVSDEKEK